MSQFPKWRLVSLKYPINNNKREQLMNIELSANTRTFTRKPDKHEAAQISSDLIKGSVEHIEELIQDIEQGIT